MASKAADSGWIFGRNNGVGDMLKVHSALWVVETGYAVGNIFQKVSYTAGLNPIVFSVYTQIVSSSCLVTMAYFAERGRRTRLDWTTLALIVFMGFIGMYCAQLLITFGISLAPGTYASLIGITTPIFVFFISAASGLEEIIWTQRSGQAKILGVVSAVCGGAIIPVYNGPEIIRPLRDAHRVPLSELPVKVSSVFSLALSNLEIGDWQLGGSMLILAGLMFAFYWTLQAYTIQRYPYPVTTAALAYSSGTLMFAATGLLTMRDPSEWAIHPSTDILSILYGGLISCGVNFALQSWVLFKAGPLLLTTYSPLQSCVTIIVAWLFLGEGIHLGSVLGLLCIVSGLFLITWGQYFSQMGARVPVKVIPPTLIIKSDSNLEQHLLE